MTGKLHPKKNLVEKHPDQRPSGWISIIKLCLAGFFLFVLLWVALLFPIVIKIAHSSTPEELVSFIGKIGVYITVFMSGLGTSAFIKSLVNKIDRLIDGKQLD